MKSWNEIRKAATVFSKRWKGAYDEKSQAQSFLKEFFEVFGVDTVQQAVVNLYCCANAAKKVASETDKLSHEICPAIIRRDVKEVA